MLAKLCPDANTLFMCKDVTVTWKTLLASFTIGVGNKDVLELYMLASFKPVLFYL